MNRGKLMVAMAKTKGNRFGVSSILRIPTLKFTGSSDSHEKVLGKKEVIEKEGLTDGEVALLKDNFGFCIETKSYLSAQDLKKFIKKTAISRTVPVIKAKLQQLFKKSDMCSISFPIHSITLKLSP
ncbi:hypothetical protein JTB14_005851 [Gonioctena quinquepunctata]|nr:hypothetical protein JTB14_005851 [Gonioctena quinquepunctata]